MSELIECGFCHSKIDPETKETTPPKDSNGMNISNIIKENKQLSKKIENCNKEIDLYGKQLNDSDSNCIKLTIKNDKLKKEIETNAKKTVTKKTPGKKPVKRKPEPEPEPKQTTEQRKEGFLTWLRDD